MCDRQVWDPALVEGSKLQADLAKDVDIVFLAFSELAGHSILRDGEFLLYETRKAVDDRIYVVGVASLPKRLGRVILAENRKWIQGKLEVGHPNAGRQQILQSHMFSAGESLWMVAKVVGE